jgi:hypothetical protein
MTNDLTRGDLPAKQISPVLSADLKRLLDSEQNDNFVASMIAGRAELRTEACNMVPVLKAAALQKAGDEGVREVVGRRFALYPQPARSDEEWAAWWADYLDTLGGVPWAALEAAMAAYVADPASEFMPKPGKLLDLAKSTPNTAVKRYDRARKVAVISGQQLPALVHQEERAEPTEAEKASVKRMLGEFQQKVSERASMAEALKPAMPSTAGKPDERGITQAMRDLIARRNA